MARTKGEFSFGELDKEMSKVDPLGSILSNNAFSKVDEWIDTGNYMLNAQISGSIFKGCPNSRSIVFSGVSGTGKTFVILNSVRGLQKMGYYVIYGDSEAAVDEDIMKKFGIDTDRVRYQPLRTVLQTRHFIANLTSTLKEKKKAGFEIPKIAMVIDSLGNLATEKETNDAMSGSDKRDMTKQQNLKSMFRVITTDLAELKIPLYIANHVYACLTDEHFVKTSEGDRRVSDIKENDKVLTLDGYKNVTDTFKYKNVDTLKIELDNGEFLECTLNHKFMVRDENSFVWKSAEDLEVDDEILKIEDISNIDIYKEKRKYRGKEIVEITEQS